MTYSVYCVGKGINLYSLTHSRHASIIGDYFACSVPNSSTGSMCQTSQCRTSCETRQKFALISAVKECGIIYCSCNDVWAMRCMMIKVVQGRTAVVSSPHEPMSSMYQQSRDIRQLLPIIAPTLLL